MAIETPHFRVPFQIDSSAAVVEQDSDREIDQCIEAVLLTPVGSRIDSPEFGRPDEIFEQQAPEASAEAYLNAIERWEPRARVRGEAVVEDIVRRVVIEQEEVDG